MNVLVLNVGSSSLKFQVIATDLERIQQNQDERLCQGEVERIGGEAIVTFQAGNSPKRKFTAPLRDIAAALDYLVRYIASDDSGVSRDQEHRRHSCGRTSRRARRRADSPSRRSSTTRSCRASKTASTLRRCTIPATSRASWRRANCSARTRRRSRSSTPRFITPFPSRLTSTRSRIISIGGTGSAATASTAPRIAMSPFATARCAA